MGSEFVDRAKLEALADDEYPVEHSGFTAPPPERCGCDECYVRSMERLAFMAGVDAVLALLDAETTEEWGVVRPSGEGESFFVADESGADLFISYHPSSVKVSRRVTSWLPSEGGEKRG